MKNIIISLSVNNSKRRMHINEQFLNENVGFEFFDAITPKNLDEIKKKYGLNFDLSTISETEASCFLSHYTLWKKIVEQDIAHLAIFEDDVYLGDNVDSFLTDFSWIPKDIDIIKIEKFFDSLKVYKNKKFSFNGRSFMRLAKSNLGTAGYIISNKGAKYLINKFEKMTNYGAIDTEIFEKFLMDKNYNVYQMFPALCVQDFILNKKKQTFVSQIEEDRKLRIENYKHKKIKRTFIFKLKRELMRVFNKLLFKIKSLMLVDCESDFK